MKHFPEPKPGPIESSLEAKKGLKRKIYQALEKDDLDLAEKLLHDLRALIEAPAEPEYEPTAEELEAERREALQLLEQVAEKAHSVEFYYAAQQINVPPGDDDKFGNN